MAIKEENLKKINDGLEKLDDEQLEQVAGGNLLVANLHDERIYNQAGISTSYHEFGADEFFAKSSKTGKDVKILQLQANFAVEMWKKIGKQPSYEELISEWNKPGAHSEPFLY